MNSPEGFEINAGILAKTVEVKKLSTRERRLALLDSFEHDVNEPDQSAMAEKFSVSRATMAKDFQWVYFEIAKSVSVENIQGFIAKFITRKEALYKAALDKRLYDKEGNEIDRGDLKLANDVLEGLFDRLAKIGWLGSTGAQVIPQQVLNAENVKILQISTSSPEQVKQILDESIAKCKEYAGILSQKG